MLAVSSVFPDNPGTHPPIILVHGAANSARVWEFWQRQLADYGWASHAVDLRGHGRSSRVDLSHTTMKDYADDVREVARQMPQTPVIMGWSMGGLIALMVASARDSAACVALAPSTPAQRIDSSITLRTGEFGPEEYGIIHTDPTDQPTMADLDLEEREVALASLSRESRLARDKRKAGVVLESLRCPLLIATGTADVARLKELYADLRLDAEFYSAEEASHWGLVLNRRALAATVPAVLEWLSGNLQASKEVCGE